MKMKLALLGAAAAVAFAPAAFAERASDGEVRIIYWQAPSTLNPFLSGGTKDVESASMIIEPLARYNHSRAIIKWVNWCLGWLAKSQPSAMAALAKI